eukprot:1384631-Pleurochrysis_carterae.AAC.1
MLDTDYLGEVNSPDEPPGLYDQTPAARRGTWSGTAKYCCIIAVHDAVVCETNRRGGARPTKIMRLK